MQERIKEIPTKPYPDAKAGTSGLRKKVPVFQQENYVENWLEALFQTQASCLNSRIMARVSSPTYTVCFAIFRRVQIDALRRRVAQIPRNGYGSGVKIYVRPARVD